MAMFGKEVEEGTVTETEDRVFTGAFTIRSGIEEAIIKKCYAIDSPKSGAFSLVTEFKLCESGITLKQTEWFKSGDAKGNKTTYVNKTTDKTYHLPGYIWVRDLILMAIKDQAVYKVSGKLKVKDLMRLEKDGTIEMRKLKVWYEGKEVEKDVPVPVDLLGKKVAIGVIEEYIDIGKKENGRYVYSKGKPVPSGEVKLSNTIDRIFLSETHSITAEILKGEKAEFVNTWNDAYKDKLIDNTQNKIAPITDGKFDKNKANKTVQTTGDNALSSDVGEGSDSTESLFNG